MTKLVEFAPGQFGNLIREGSDSRESAACATCGQVIGYAGMAERMTDGAKVHFMKDRDVHGRVLDCVTGQTFVTAYV